MKTQDNQTPANISKWMPLWIGDLRRETNGKPLEFIALYVNLMMAAWENGGQLQDDEEYLFRASGAISAKQWMTHRQALANLFVPRHGAWTHNLIRTELLKAAAVAQRRKEASKKGNASRWGSARMNAKDATDALMEKIAKDGAAY
jgi:uncharacterized protein YdaU (DUF1376 family)